MREGMNIINYTVYTVVVGGGGGGLLFSHINLIKSGKAKKVN